MKPLTEYRYALKPALGYLPTEEHTRKVLMAVGLAWSEEKKWSLPLRLVGNEDYRLDLLDADDALIVQDLALSEAELDSLQRILSAANVELARQAPTPAPLFVRQGDTSPR